MSQTRARILFCLDLLVALAKYGAPTPAVIVRNRRTFGYMDDVVLAHKLFDNYRAAAMLNLDALEDALPAVPMFYDVATLAASDVAHWLHSGDVGSEIRPVCDGDGDQAQAVPATFNLLMKHISINDRHAIIEGGVIREGAADWADSFHGRVLASLIVGDEYDAHVGGANGFLCTCDFRPNERVRDLFARALHSVEAPGRSSFDHAHRRQPGRRDEAVIDVGPYLSAVHVATAAYLLRNHFHTTDLNVLGGDAVPDMKKTSYCLAMLDAFDELAQAGKLRDRVFESVAGVLLFIAANAPDSGGRQFLTAVSYKAAENLACHNPVVVNYRCDSYDDDYPVDVDRYNNPLHYDVLVNTPKLLIDTGVVTVERAK